MTRLRTSTLALLWAIGMILVPVFPVFGQFKTGGIELRGLMDTKEQAAPSVSASGFCRWYADSTSHTAKLSCNGGSYSNVLMSAGLISVASGKTFTVSNTLTLAGTDGTVMTFPSTSATIARTDAANSFTGNQTLSTGNIIFGAASAKVIPGATSLLFRNNADTASNIAITDAGAITISGRAATETAHQFTGTTTSAQYVRWTNTGGDLLLCIDSSVGARCVGSSAAYSGAVGTISNTPFSIITNNAKSVTVAADGAVKLDKTTGTVTERNRSVAMGEEVPVTFASGNYTASTGNWTLTSPDQEAFSYSLVGKTMYLVIVIDFSTVSATPTELRMAIPGGFTASSYNVWTITYSDAGGAVAHGRAYVNPGDSTIKFLKIGAANWSTSTDTTAVSLNGILFVQ